MPPHDADTSRRLSEQRFSQHADAYVTSAVHAQDPALARLVALAESRSGPDAVMLDVATGGGHTALAFAPHVGRVYATDRSAAMLHAARKHLSAAHDGPVIYVQHDAEHLPFAENTLDIVACRLALHHVPDAFRFAQEAARTLKPGGLLLIHDHLLPPTERDAAYIEAFERLRDPSHHRAFSEAEWRGLLLDVGLEVIASEVTRRRANLHTWAQRQGCTPEVTLRLDLMLTQAPQPVREWMQPRCLGTTDASFDHVALLITGRKPDND